MTMKGLVFAGLALLCGSLGVSAVRAATLAVQPEVICPDPVMAALISHTLDQELRSEHYTLHATWPAVRLILYAVPTVGNRKNPHGWSIAVAHAAVAPLLEALGPIAKSSPHLATDARAKALLTIFTHSSGILTYLSVVNADRLDVHNVPLILGSIVNAFRKRWPPSRGAPPAPPLAHEPRSFAAPPTILRGPGGGAPPH